MVRSHCPHDCKPTYWNVHFKIILYRSSYKEISVDLTAILHNQLDYFGNIQKAFVGGAMLCVGGITVAICFTLINMEILKRKQEVLEQKHFQVRQKVHCFVL